MKAALFLSLIFLASSVKANDFRTLYGEDDRQDIYQVESEKLKNVARSIAAVVWKPKVEKGETHTAIEIKSLRKRIGYCKDERFADQPSAPFGTAFLVGPRYVISAGHVIDSDVPCEEAVIMFDYALTEESTDLSHLPNESIYHCKKVLERKVRLFGEDYELIELDREVTGSRQILEFAKPDEIQPGVPVIGMGHPQGLPLKISGNARILDIKTNGRFSYDGDMDSGNSGSPVFNALTMKVLGIHVTGELHSYSIESGCKRDYFCNEPECTGSWAYRPPEEFLTDFL